MTEDEMAGWHQQLNGHEFEQASGVGDGQESLVCCSPWGHKETDMTEQLTYTYKLTYTYERTHLDFINYIHKHSSQKGSINTINIYSYTHIHTREYIWIL